MGRKGEGFIYDIEYVERAFSRYKDSLYALSLSLLDANSSAEDVVQNTFTKLCTTDKVFESEEHLRSWLLKVAANECRTLNRKGRRHPAVPYDESKAVQRESDQVGTDSYDGLTFRDINEC